MIIHNLDELKKYKELDYHLACELLDIDVSTVEKNEITLSYIKKKYHKMSLKYHPDKNNNTTFSKEYFQKINESYNYLTYFYIYNDIDNNEIDVDINYLNKSDSYLYILTTFINSIVKGNYKENIINIIKEIVINYKDKITCKAFEGLDKDTTIEIYHFLAKYKDTLYISNEILSSIYDCIKEKFKDLRVYILNPTINDLLDNNVYKLVINENLYLVPLWHNELYFDSPEGELIVINKPELPENITIDESNNIVVVLRILFDKQLLHENKISFYLGKKKYDIQCETLFIKKCQYIILKKEGISKIMENDIYNVSNKCDIIVKIIFIDPDK